MRKTKYFPAYEKKVGEMKPRPVYKKRNKKGVYIIKKNGVVKYIGKSLVDVYKALYRHFQSWNDRSQTRVTYKNKTGYTVRVIELSDNAKINRLEKILISKLRPTDNPQQYDIDFKPSDQATIDKINDLEAQPPF